MTPFSLTEFGESRAVVLSNGDSISYAKLATMADSAVASLYQHDLLAVECDNSIESLLVYLGAIRNGICVLPLESALNVELKNKLLANYSVSTVFSASEKRFKRFHQEGPERHKNLALLLSTSGSTGSPKLVRLSLANVLANARQISEYLALGSHSRAITSLPLHYSFGLSVVHSHLAAGGSLVLTNSSVTEMSFWNQFKEFEADSISGVPSTFEMMKKIRFERVVGSSLKVLTQAGGRLSRATAKHYADLALKKAWNFYIMYGQTEATARMSYLPPAELSSNLGSVGVAIPQGRFELIGDDGVIVTETNCVGELVYYGPNVMMGYAESAADLVKGDEHNGRLETGDLAEFGSSGLLSIVGRKKRFIKIHGNRFSLDEIEKLLEEHGLELVITGQDDLLVVAGLDATNVSIAEKKITDKYRIHKSCIASVILQEIPRNASGKIQYSEIMHFFLGNKESVNAR